MASGIFYKWSSYRRLFKYFSWLIRLFEKPRIKKFAQRQGNSSPIFILGLPRSGSTFLYQLLTSLFDVIYFDNLVNLGRNNLFFSVGLSNFFYKNRVHNSFSSDYGNTDDSGLHAPSEAGTLWYRWFPKDAVEIGLGELSDKAKNDLKQNISSLIGRHNKPLLIKNLYMVHRMKVLKEVFPDARYIYIQRDPLYIAQSIYQARLKNLKDPKTEWWSVPVPGYESLLKLPVEEQIAHQVNSLQRIIREELSDIDPAKILEVKYEELEINDIKRRCSEFIGIDVRKEFLFSEDQFRQGNVQKVDDEVLSRLQSELNRIFDA